MSSLINGNNDLPSSSKPFNLESDLSSIINNSFPENKRKLISYEILMSQTMGFSGAKVLEIECFWEGNSDSSSSSSTLPNKLFLKEITVLPTTQQKVSISYQNENNFLKYYAPNLNAIPITYQILNDNNKHYLFISESLVEKGRQVGKSFVHQSSIVFYIPTQNLTIIESLPSNHSPIIKSIYLILNFKVV